jgi:hypothetical protein
MRRKWLVGRYVAIDGGRDATTTHETRMNGGQPASQSLSAESALPQSAERRAQSAERRAQSAPSKACSRAKESNDRS